MNRPVALNVRTPRSSQGRNEPFEESSLTTRSVWAMMAARLGRTRTALERKGQPIGPMDLLIAAHALSLGARLVTSNEREFRRVPGLRVENWL